MPGPSCSTRPSTTRWWNGSRAHQHRIDEAFFLVLDGVAGDVHHMGRYGPVLVYSKGVDLDLGGLALVHEAHVLVLQVGPGPPARSPWARMLRWAGRPGPRPHREHGQLLHGPVHRGPQLQQAAVRPAESASCMDEAARSSPRRRVSIGPGAGSPAIRPSRRFLRPPSAASKLDPACSLSV